MDQPNSQQLALLNAVDKLRSLGLGNVVNLPQLVICGSPPAQRAALLEAITKIPFSQKGNFYSQYTTEVILRQGPNLTIRITIQPGDSRSDEERQKLVDFAPKASSNPEDVPTLIEEAEKYMDASTETQEDIECSEDILRVEITGPLKPNFTLLDPPGLYTSTSKKVSDGEHVVSRAMEKYMSNPQSIILAVASAKKSQHLQALLESVKKFDPEYKRVLGVITNIEDFEPGSDEKGISSMDMNIGSYARLINKETINFALGWHLLCGHPILPRKARIVEKKAVTVDQDYWSSIPDECFGIENLQRRLSDIVLKHAQGNVLQLTAQLQERMQSTQQILARLGPLRLTHWEKWGYLQDISSGFQRITNQALAGVYLDDFFGTYESGAVAGDAYQHSRLRTLIRALSDEFVRKLTLYGSYRIILEPGDAVPLPAFESSAYSKHQNPIYVRRDQLENQVTEAILKNRGIDHPECINQLLVGYMFRTQAMPWQAIAETHLGIVWESVRYFVPLVLQYLTDGETCSALMDTLIIPELDKMKEALEEKLGELTSYTNDCGDKARPLPIGRGCLETILQAWEKAEDTAGRKRNPVCQQDLVDHFRSKLHLSAEKSEASQIIDEMQAYYDTALMTFANNIATLAVENCLIRPLGRLFNDQTVSSLSKEQISNLASETPEAQNRRKCHQQELEKLQAGLHALSQLRIKSPPSGFAPPAPSPKPTPGSTFTEPSFFGIRLFTPVSSDIPKQPQSLFNQPGAASHPPVHAQAPPKPTPERPFKLGWTEPFNPSNYPSTVAYRHPIVSREETGGNLEFQHICCAEGYAQYSPEELRVGDYARGDKPPVKSSKVE